MHASSHRLILCCVMAACVGAAELRKPAAVPTPGGGREHGGDAGRWSTPEALRREQPPPRRVRWGAALAWLAPGPPVARLSLLAAAAVYVAFQKKLLGKAVSRMVARCYFWPTLPFTMALRWGNLVTKMDDTVLVGVAPVGFQVNPQVLHRRGVRGVINLCDEFRGPRRQYARLGMEELWLPTVDHWEPSVASIRSAVKFISRYSERGEKVYVHCKAGHGRSAAVVFCWLASQKPDMEPEAITRSMLSRRKVRKKLHIQPSVRSFLREQAAKRIASSSSSSS